MPLATYIDNQPEVSERMRAILIDWIVEVNEKFKLSAQTLYQTVNLIDRYLSVAQVPRSQL